MSFFTPLKACPLLEAAAPRNIIFMHIKCEKTKSCWQPPFISATLLGECLPLGVCKDVIATDQDRATSLLPHMPSAENARYPSGACNSQHPSGRRVNQVSQTAIIRFFLLLFMYAILAQRDLQVLCEPRILWWIYRGFWVSCQVHFVSANEKHWWQFLHLSLPFSFQELKWSQWLQKTYPELQ